MPELCIGSAQFGLPYGITNSSGAVPYNEVASILRYALKNSITLIDTAQSYGDAEKVLGESLPNLHNFKLTSKLVPQSDPIFTSESTAQWEEAFRKTLMQLRVDRLHSFLLHDVMDLAKAGSIHLQSWLLSLKERGLVKNVGVSIYEPIELEAIDLSIVDVVQLPYSIYDQRMYADGTLKMLRNNNIKVQARSVFLQGLLLTEPDSWPEWIPHNERDHHRAFVSAVKSRNLTLLQSALQFVFSQPLLDSIVVGFCSLRQVEETCTILKSITDDPSRPLCEWSLSGSSILLDPRRWPACSQ